jgi:hypothetical protein
MLLSKIQKELLKLIVKRNRIKLSEVYKIKQFVSINVPEEADFLMKQGLISINKSTITYEPTVQGKHFFELERKSFSDRILTPVSVTLLTELILHVLKWLLPLIVKLF